MTQKEVIEYAKEDIRTSGSFVLPTNHPDNNLNCVQTKYFSKMEKIADKLVDKGVLDLMDSCRRVSGYKFNDEWIIKKIKKDKSYIKIKEMQDEMYSE